MKKPLHVRNVTMRAALKQYDMPCRNLVTSWLSDEMTRTLTDYSDGVSTVLSSSNYTNSTHRSTDDSLVQNLDDISKISGTGPSYVEKWLYKQPKSSTPRKNQSLLHDTHSGCTARRNLFCTDNERIPAPPTSERPPTIGAEIEEESDSVSNVLPKPNVQYTIDGCSTAHINYSIQSDDTLFLENPLYTVPVTTTRKARTLLKRLKLVRKKFSRSSALTTLAVL